MTLNQNLIIMREDMVKISDIIKHMKDTGVSLYNSI